MGIVLHLFLPTNGDSRTDLSLGNAVGAVGSRAAEDGDVWSAATTKWRSGSPSTTHSASTSSCCPVTRTWSRMGCTARSRVHVG